MSVGILLWAPTTQPNIFHSCFMNVGQYSVLFLLDEKCIFLGKGSCVKGETLSYGGSSYKNSH
jgi:hypothetical protein